MPSSESQRDTECARSIAALLNRLALHCPVRNLPAPQAALLMEDTITDLLPFDPRDVADACTKWRQGNNPFFPISGQLIAFIKAASEARIPHPGGHARTTYRAPESDRKLLANPVPKVVKSWREILAERRKVFVVPSEAEAPPPKPAEQERVDASGALSPERRAELRALREKLVAGQ